MLLRVKNSNHTMILILVILQQLFTLCWSGKPLDYTPLLKYLDDDIMRDLTDPLEGRGQVLLDYVKKYKNRLGDTRDMIQQDVYEAYIKAIELKKIGGPQFLKSKIDKELLKKVYNWAEDDLGELQKRFESAKKAWGEVEAEFGPAEVRFKSIQEADAKEKADQVKREQERMEKIRKAEEEFNERVSVNMATEETTPS